MTRKSKFRRIALIALLICVASWFLSQPLLNILNVLVYALTSFVVLLMAIDNYRQE